MRPEKANKEGFWYEGDYDPGKSLTGTKIGRCVVARFFRNRGHHVGSGAGMHGRQARTEQKTDRMAIDVPPRGGERQHHFVGASPEKRQERIRRKTVAEAQ